MPNEPNWFVEGKALAAEDLDKLDASEFIESCEWDYEWRLCDVPISLLPSPAISMADIAERKRMESIESWLLKIGVDNALNSSPVVLLFTSQKTIKVLDGYHRIAAVKCRQISTIKAAVGFGDPSDEF